MRPRGPKRNSPLDRRTRRALEQRDKLAAKYMAEGKNKAEATELALTEMRSNPKMDWRKGPR